MRPGGYNMGSRAPAARKPAQDERPQESISEGSASLNTSAQSQLLGRIAEALQMSMAAFYNPQNAVETTTRFRAPPILSGEIEREGAELLRAYMRISNPEERRRLLALLRAAAEET